MEAPLVRLKWIFNLSELGIKSDFISLNNDKDERKSQRRIERKWARERLRYYIVLYNGVKTAVLLFMTHLMFHYLPATFILNFNNLILLCIWFDDDYYYPPKA